MKLWKQLVGLFFLLVIFDGALRKWVLPSQETALLLLKDVVLWGGFVMYASRRSPIALPRPLRRTWIPALLAAYIFVVLLQAFNLRQPSLIVSAIGLKAHLAYIPLVILLPALIAQATERQILRVLWRYGIFIQLPIIALCIYQFFQPPTAWINQYVREMGHIATVGEHPRITGTFSYIGEFVAYLRFSVFLSVSVLFAGLRWRRRKLTMLGVVLVGGGAIVVPMPGSRGLMVVVFCGLAALFMVMRLTRGQRLRILSVAVLVIVLIVQGFGDSDFLQGWEALGERVERTSTARAGDRTVNMIMAPVTGLNQAGLVGYGVGTNHKASIRFVSVSDWAGSPNIDNGALRVIMELGILGWLVLIAMKIALLYAAYQTVRKSQSPVESIIGATAFCVLLSQVLLPVVFRLVASALYWGSAGAVLGIWCLQQMRERRGVRQQQKVAVSR